jgi:hypothetical protein
MAIPHRRHSNDGRRNAGWLKEIIAELADLPLCWIAARENPQSPWQRSPRTE